MAKYRKYSKEFKLQAAKLVTQQGYSYDKAAKQLGTTGFSIRNWVTKFRQSGELPAQNETQPKADELPRQRQSVIFKFIEVFYNRKCRHKTLGYVSPVVYEEMYEMKQERAA